MEHQIEPTVNISSRPIYCDIDGTLTDNGAHPGNPIPARIQKIKEIIAKSKDVSVIVWSARGTKYAREFCLKHGIDALAIGKPSKCIDDHKCLFGPSTEIILADRFFKE